MIVKNESKIIKDTLLNISKYIDYWVISDTGSTDNTIDEIEKIFDQLKIPGKIFQDEWKDFGTNRTLGLKHALDESIKNNLDYIFVMDADDLIEGEFKWPEIMDADGYYLKFGKNFVYLRQQIFKSTLDWVYRGVVHEYPECVNKKPTNIIKIEGEYYINSRRLGNRSSDPEKYLKDALILEKAIEENKEPELLSRYLFYTGQSYYDYNNYEKSLYWYKKRVEYGGWIEETYYSITKIAECMIKLSYESNEIIKILLIGINMIKERPECYYILGDYFESLYDLENNDEKKNKFLNLSYFYFNLLNNLSYNPERDSGRLFLNKEIFNWLGKYKFGVISFKLKKYHDVKNSCDEILNIVSNRINIYIYEKVENLKNEALKKILLEKEKKITSYPNEIINKLVQKYKNTKSQKKIILTMTTCKRLNLFIKTINSFLNCCKDIDLIDDWLIIDDNSSIEDRDIMKYDYPFVNWIFKNEEQKGHANSMNLIREMTKNYEYIIHLEDDWLFFESTYYIKPALDILESINYKLYESEEHLSNELKNKKIVQVLFNKNYSETLDNIVWGGFLMETSTNLRTKFLLHEHSSENTTNKFRFENKPNCAYWPHYSFRPSIFKREIFDELGEFEGKGFFERKYADKFYSSNYLSCFYDKITCLHIGKLTNSEEGTNAYELNNVNQGISKFYKNMYDNKNLIFLPNLDSMSNDIIHIDNSSINDYINISTSLDDCVCFNTYGYFKSKLEKNLINLPNKFYKPDGLFIDILKTHDEIICLNLKRRPDRREQVEKQFISQNIKYRFWEAIDGMELTPNKELINLFKSNDFGSRKGVIGCALSHLGLWKELINNITKKYYIITEDDIKLHNNFKNYLHQIQNKLLDLDNWDILFLGYHTFNNKKKLYNLDNYYDDIQIKFIDFDNENYIGGTFGYIVTKSGAKKLLSYIELNGISHGIDYLIKIVPNLQIFQLEKFIVYSDWVNTLESDVDTDIQKNFDYLDIYSDENFEYVRGLDSSNNDIEHVKNLTIEEMKIRALDNDDCVCFNTLGFFKSKLNELKKTPYYKNISDGIYIKKHINNKINKDNDKIYRIKMICNWTDSKTLCDEWNWMSKGDYKWDNIEITWEDSDIDYYVIINKPKPEDFYIGEKTIIFQMEPQCVNSEQNWGVKTWGEWANPDSNKFSMIRTNKEYLNCTQWQLNLTYNYLKNEKITKDEIKNKIISSICSSKYYDPGHIKRIDFLSYLESKNDPEIKLDIYNADNLHGFKSYKGQLSMKDKHLGILPYKYYFMCENNSEPNYITEKFWEPIISETLIFYWGCPNVSDYINPLAYVQLDMDDFEKSYQIIKNALENNLWEQRIQYIREEKEKILDYYNFFPTLKRIIEDK